MSEVLNDRDAVLQAAAVRIINPKNARVLLDAVPHAFHMNSAGALDAATMTITASLLGLEGDVTFTAEGVTLTNVTGKSVTVRHADMQGPVAMVTASIVAGGETFSQGYIVSTLRDGATGGSGTRGAGFYRATGNAWSDGIADAITPGGNVTGDIVTISNGTSSWTKEWDGSKWFFPGAFLPGNLLVEKSIYAAHLAAGAVTASSLAVGFSSENVIPDPQMIDTAWWVHGTLDRGSNEGTGNGWKSNYCLRFSAGQIGYNIFRDVSTPYFPLVIEGLYRVEFQIFISSDFDGMFTPVLHLPNKAWFDMGSGHMGWSWNAVESGLPVAFDKTSPKGLRKFSAYFRADNAYVHRAQFRLIFKGFAGYIEFGGVSVVRATDNVLIEDGAITANKMNLPWGGYINSGQWGFDQGDGFWLQGGDNPRFSIGAGQSRLTFQKSTGTLKMRGAIEGSVVRASVFSMESARILTPWNRLAPFVVYDQGNHLRSGGGYVSVTLGHFCGPHENNENVYDPRRLASFRKDFFMRISAVGLVNSYDEYFIEQEYHLDGTWNRIGSFTTHAQQQAVNINFRYTPADGGWNYIKFRVRSARGAAASLTFDITVYNFNESSNAPYSTSQIINDSSGAGGGGGYTAPEPWCVDAETTMLPNGGYVRDLAVNDLVAVWNDDPVKPAIEHSPVQQIRFGREESFLLQTESGVEIIQSKSTPMTLRDGRIATTDQMLGEDVLVNRKGALKWETVTALINVGERRVVKVSLGDRMYFAGKNPNATIATHNIEVKP